MILMFWISFLIGPHPFSLREMEQFVIRASMKQRRIPRNLAKTTIDGVKKIGKKNEQLLRSNFNIKSKALFLLQILISKRVKT